VPLWLWPAWQIAKRVCKSILFIQVLQCPKGQRGYRQARSSSDVCLLPCVSGEVVSLTCEVEYVLRPILFGVCDPWEFDRGPARSQCGSAERFYRSATGGESTRAQTAR
jgi:hypothetical protein